MDDQGAANQHFGNWSATNLEELEERLLRSNTVWCGVANSCVIGAYNLEEGGQPVKVNSQLYLLMLNNFLIHELWR